MVELNVPGYKKFRLSFLVIDYNGTIARDGNLLPGVADLIRDLSKSFKVHILTADTFGGVRKELSRTSAEIAVIGKEKQAQAKADYVLRLGAEETVALGNGRNDALMLKEAALGIALIQEEGCAVEALLAADIVMCRICDALDLLLNPLRLAATLRS